MIYSNKIPQQVYSDPNRIKQVTLNFLNNALKFTKEGQIALKADLVDEKSIKVTVTDTGIGIEQQNINKIFTLFDRVDLGS